MWAPRSLWTSSATSRNRRRSFSNWRERPGIVRSSGMAREQHVDGASGSRHAFAMRRGAAVLGICFAAWPRLALGDAPAPAASSTAAPPPPPAPPASAQPSAPPAAPGTPGAEQIQFAAREHDLGYRAYVEDEYDEAASHFENAYFAAPNPAELRSAIRARRDAGELARAASLAAIGQRKYPDDASLAKLADETIGAAKPKVFEVRITSPEECNVAVDQKVVAAEKVRDFRFFVDPGKHDLLVGWSDDRTKHVAIDAAAGGVQNLNL